MFCGCISLKSLDLKNFFLLSNVNLNNIFYNCLNLEYINIFNFNAKKAKYYDNMFFGTSDYLIYCINDYIKDTDGILVQLTSKNCSVKDCSTNWKESKKRIIEGKNMCINDCSTISYYEYNYKCYPECPNGTIPSLKNEYLCEDEIIVNNSINDKDINVNNINNNDNNINSNKNQYENLKEKYENNPDIIKYIYQESINNFINDIKYGILDNEILTIINKEKENETIEDYIVNDQNIVFQITTTYNQNHKKYDNISTINIEEECQNILKEKYNISKNDSLLIFKYEYFIPNLNIPIIGYDVFHPITKKQLDLTYCENSNVNLNIPVIIDEDNLEKYNPDSDFYNNICKSYTNEKGLDLTIYERKKEYNYYNMSLCPKNCKYNGYDRNTKKVSCECEIQTKESALLLEDVINIDKLLNNFVNIKSISKIGLFKCYKETFSKEGIKSNILSYILLIIIFIFVTSCILFFAKEYKLLFNRIDEIVNLGKKENIIITTNNEINNVNNKGNKGNKNIKR